jgi:hypothetical protein
MLLQSYHRVAPLFRCRFLFRRTHGTTFTFFFLSFFLSFFFFLFFLSFFSFFFFTLPLRLYARKFTTPHAAKFSLPPCTDARCTERRVAFGPRLGRAVKIAGTLNRCSSRNYVLLGGAARGALRYEGGSGRPGTKLGIRRFYAALSIPRSHEIYMHIYVHTIIRMYVFSLVIFHCGMRTSK